MSFLYNLSAPTKDDALWLLADRFIGQGYSRRVYSFRFDPHNKVVKISDAENDQPDQNWKEWMVWEAVKKDKELKKWFAPCHFISPGGYFLVQSRTEPITYKELKRRLKYIPRFLTDTKVGNWGRLGSRIVVHDYGTCFATETGLANKMKRAEWWDNRAAFTPRT